MIYHTSSQQQYYKDQFPWLSSKSQFVLLGVDYEYWKNKIYPDTKEKNSYIVCVGYRKRDWKTLLEAYEKAKIIFGNTPEFKGIQDIYDKKINEINKVKKNNKIIWGAIIAFFAIPICFLIFYAFYSAFNK